MPARQPIQPNNSIKLTRRGAQQLLHKSVFHICAHEGFDGNSSVPVVSFRAVNCIFNFLQLQQKVS